MNPMKTLSGKFTQLLLAAFFILCCSRVEAGLQIPYTPDAHTTHLWHFDASGGILTTDEVQTASITLTNMAQTNVAPVPSPSISLGNISFPGMSNCLHIVPTNLLTGNTFAFADGGPALNSTLIDTNSGAFTFEALVNMDVSPFVAGTGENWEIVCGDNSANGLGVRGWQFRISTGPSANINFNAAPGVNAAVNNLTIPLPTSGPDTVVAGQWYHVAVTFTGTSPTNGDTPNLFTVYWTLRDANRTNADILQQITVASGVGILPAVTSTIGVGGNGRANNGVANNEGFKGFLDELHEQRVSEVERDGFHHRAHAERAEDHFKSGDEYVHWLWANLGLTALASGNPAGYFPMAAGSRNWLYEHPFPNQQCAGAQRRDICRGGQLSSDCNQLAGQGD